QAPSLRHRATPAHSTQDSWATACFDRGEESNPPRGRNTQRHRLGASRGRDMSMGNGWTTSALLGMGSPWRWVGAALVLVTACARSAPVSGPSGPAADKPPLARTAPASQPPLEAPNEASVEQRFEHYLSAYRDLDYAGLKRELGLKQPKSSGLSFD